MKPKIKTVFIEKKLKKLEPRILSPKEWISRAEFHGKIVNKTLNIYILSLLCILGIFLLEGFKIAGFVLPEQLLYGLSGATVGQAAALAIASFRLLHKS